MSQNSCFFSPPVTPRTITSRFKCNVCEKEFKSKRNLISHLNIIVKYNSLRSDLDILPENTIHQFKGILVHYIRK